MLLNLQELLKEIKNINLEWYTEKAISNINILSIFIENEKYRVLYNIELKIDGKVSEIQKTLWKNF